MKITIFSLYKHVNQVRNLSFYREGVGSEVSQKTAEMFNSELVRVQEQSMTQIIQDAQSLSYMTRLAESIGASDAYSYLSKAQEVQSSSTSMGMDIMPGFVVARSIARYGDASEANIMKTVYDINDMVTNQGVQGQRQFESEIGMYQSRRGMFSDLAQGDLGRFRSQAQGSAQGSDIRTQVSSAASEAREHSANISGRDFEGKPEGWQEPPDLTSKGAGIMDAAHRRAADHKRRQKDYLNNSGLDTPEKRAARQDARDNYEYDDYGNEPDFIPSD